VKTIKTFGKYTESQTYNKFILVTKAKNLLLFKPTFSSIERQPPMTYAARDQVSALFRGLSSDVDGQ